MISKIIDTYLKGWELGDGELSLSVTADDFTYDDPDSGTIQRQDFVEFVNDFKRLAIDEGADKNAKPFLLYSDKVIQHENDISTIWCWWQANGTDLQGSAVIKASEQGILHEKIAYFSKLP